MGLGLHCSSPSSSICFAHTARIFSKLLTMALRALRNGAHVAAAAVSFGAGANVAAAAVSFAAGAHVVAFVFMKGPAS
jgi:hypothetical protein